MCLASDIAQRSSQSFAVFLFPGGLGVSEYLRWRSVMPNSIILSPEASCSSPALFLAPYFDERKDVVIPGYLPPNHWSVLVASALPLQERPTLISYHGNRPQPLSVARMLLKQLGEALAAAGAGEQQQQFGRRVVIDVQPDEMAVQDYEVDLGRSRQGQCRSAGC